MLSASPGATAGCAGSTMTAQIIPFPLKRTDAPVIAGTIRPIKGGFIWEYQPHTPSRIEAFFRSLGYEGKTIDPPDAG